MNFSSILLVFVALFASSISAESTIRLERRHGPNGTVDYSAEIQRAAAKYAHNAMVHFKNTGKHHQVVNGTKLQKRSGTGKVNLAQNDAWSGQINIGSPAQTLWVQFDTGSADLVLNHGAYKHEESKTSKDLNKKFSMNYVGGPVSGFVYSDQVSVGGIKVKGVAVADDDSVLAGMGGDQLDGILGLGFPRISGLSRSGVSEPTFIEAAKNQHALKKNLFQLTLRVNGGSTLNVGKIDESEVQGGLGWVGVNDSDGHWKTDVEINGQMTTGIVDSGTTLVIAPVDQYEKVLGNTDKLNIKKNDKGEYNGYYNCDDPPIVKFKVAGKELHMNQDTMSFERNGNQCRLAFVSIDGFNDWIYGALFMATASVVFDVDNVRLGFGQQS